MAYKSIPWPGTAAAGPYYSAQDWTLLQKSLVCGDYANQGILPGMEAGMIGQHVSGSLTIKIRKGAALINGLLGLSDADIDLTCDAADPTYTRLDLAVYRSDSTAKTATVVLKKGTPGASPTPPALDQSGAPYYEIPLVMARVRAAATSFVHSDLTNYNLPALSPLHLIMPVYNASGSAIYQRHPVGKNLTGISTPSMRGTPADAFNGYPWAVPGAGGTADPIIGFALHTISPGAWGWMLVRGPLQLPVSTGVVVAYGGIVGLSSTSSQVYGWTLQANSSWPVGWMMSYAPDSVVSGSTAWVFIDCQLFNAEPRLFRRVEPVTTNVTTTSTSYVDLLATAIQPFVRTRFLRVRFSGVISVSVAGTLVSLGMKFASGITPGSVTHDPLWVGTGGANYPVQVQIDRIIKIDAEGGGGHGAHCVQLVWKTAAGTATFYRAAGYPQSELIIQEVPYAAVANLTDY